MKITYDKTIEKSCGFLFARWSAGAKAFDHLVPPEKRIISDPFARYFAGKVGMQTVNMMQSINPSIRKAIVLRARYIDDFSRRCLNEGFEQVVLLGAGYDSRFFRLKEFHNAKIFELDLNSTQVIKKTLTRRLLGRLPQNVVYVSIDFSKDSITEKLMNNGFEIHKRSLFVWEGVTLFLNKDIVAETLGRLVGTRPGNRVIFDFVPDELIKGETDYRGNKMLLKLCTDLKEPLTFGCHPNEMKALLQNLGYQKVRIINMREVNHIYCDSDQIEDSYFFASAEIGNGSSSQSGYVNHGNLYVPANVC